MAWNDVINGGKGNEQGKLDYTKFEAGKPTKIRIMDAEPVSKWRHWIQASKRSVTCLGKGCPVCETIKQQKEAGMTPTYSSSFKHTIHVYNKTTNKLELLEQGKGFFEQLLGYMNAIGDLRDFDLTVTKNGSGKNTTYVIIPGAKEEVTEEIKALYEANKCDIEEKIKAYTVEQTRGFMEGKDPKEIFADNDEESEIEL